MADIWARYGGTEIQQCAEIAPSQTGSSVRETRGWGQQNTAATTVVVVLCCTSMYMYVRQQQTTRVVIQSSNTIPCRILVHRTKAPQRQFRATLPDKELQPSERSAHMLTKKLEYRSYHIVMVSTVAAFPMSAQSTRTSCYSS